MTWIRTVPLAEAGDALTRAIEAQRALYPIVVSVTNRCRY